jgi:hypothetical protein
MKIYYMFIIPVDLLIHRVLLEILVKERGVSFHRCYVLVLKEKKKNVNLVIG